MLAVAVALCELSAFAQGASVSQNGKDQVKTDSRILYHNGAIMVGDQDVYLIWYGCCDDNCGNFGNTTTQAILTDFLSNVGGSPYFQINAMYVDGAGQSPTGGLFYGAALRTP